MAARVELRTTLNQSMAAVVPTSAAEYRFVQYWLTANYASIRNLAGGDLRDGLNLQHVKSVGMPLPPVTEQKAIADFLDGETAEIDAFIRDQEELVRLLGERRRATISNAISKGLDTNATMKESGVAWIGSVPSTWEVANIRRYAQMRTGHTPSRSIEAYWLECHIPWFTLADVWQLREGRKYISDTKEKISDIGLANSAADLLPSGTVILSRTASVGFSGILSRPMATSQDFWNWVCSPDLMPEYLWYQFLAMAPVFGQLSHGSTHKTIYQSDAASLSVVVPPFAEQAAIVDYLNAEATELGGAIHDAREAITLFRERRAALISAAVTGKIDVRERAEGA